MSFFTRTTTAPAAAFDAATQVVDDITGDYTLDVTHSRLGFSARHAMVTTVRGQFKDFSGTAHIDAANPAASSVTVTIVPSSVDTGNADRDAHLKSGDFFQVEDHSEITFVSTRVEREDDVTWQITGDLTIKGITREVTIEFEQTGSARDPFGNLRVGFRGRHRHQPQGLGPDVERHAGDRRRAGLRQDPLGLRHQRDPELLINLSTDPPETFGRVGVHFR